MAGAAAVKRCPDCKETKPLGAFYKSKNTTNVSGTSSYCKQCTLARQRDYNERNAEAISERRKVRRETPEGLRKSRDRDLRRHYGIGLVDLERMIRAQEGRCAICSEKFESDKRTHVDHCHYAGTIRGILCVTCNLMLGHAKDDPKRLLAAVQYLELPT